MKILLSSNMEIIKKYLNKGASVGFIPTASELDNDRWYMEQNRDNLVKMGYNVTDIEVSYEERDDIINKLNKSDAVFISGGNSFYLLQQLKSKDLVDVLVHFANEKIYIGSSAGSCIASPSISYVEKLDDKNDAPNLNNYEALNLFNGYILPHYNSDVEYSKLIDEIVDENPSLNFIKLTNSDAIIVSDYDSYEVVHTD